MPRVVWLVHWILNHYLYTFHARSNAKLFMYTAWRHKRAERHSSNSPYFENGRWCVASCTSSGRKFWYPLNRRLGGVPEAAWTIWRQEKKSCPYRNRVPYNNYDIPVLHTRTGHVSNGNIKRWAWDLQMLHLYFICVFKIPVLSM